ncbi:MAG: apolipoprotein N-acyltransferase [Chlamydiales bacterium]
MKIENFTRSVVYVLLSFLIVAFAQPDWLFLTSLIAAAFGYALFWKGTLCFGTKKLRFLSAALWYGAVQAVHVGWFFSTEYLGYFALIPYVTVILLKGVQFGLLSLFVPCQKKHIFAVAGFWVLMEWVCFFCLLSGYPIDPVGIHLGTWYVGFQLAALVGVLGLSFWVMVTNLTFFHYFSFRWRSIVLCSCVALFPYLYGGVQVAFHKGKMENSASALLVQTSLPPELKMPMFPMVQPFSPQVQWERHLSMLSGYYGEKFDFLIFPEGAVFGGVEKRCFSKQSVQEAFLFYFGETSFLPECEGEWVSNAYWSRALANAFSADVVIGLEDLQQKGSSYELINAAFHFPPNSEKQNFYAKQMLVPMGEYVPLRWLMKYPPLSYLFSLAMEGALVEDMLMFTKGKESTLFLSHIPFSSSVCYEEMYGHLMRKGRLKGAKLHVNVTNDSWFPRSRLPTIHFLHSRLRAVEQGIPLLRACNTGVTCGVDSLGRIVGSLPPDCVKTPSNAGVLKITLPLHTYTTLYTYVGDYLIIFLALLCCGFAVVKK